jgi:hypothetical protein
MKFYMFPVFNLIYPVPLNMAYREPIQGQFWYNWRQRKLTELMGLQERDDTSSLYSDNSENCILPEHTVVDTHEVKIYIFLLVIHCLVANQFIGTHPYPAHNRPTSCTFSCFYRACCSSSRISSKS